MSSTISAAASSAQENAALNQLMSKYKQDLARGAAANTLASLSRQITVAATAAGQHVTLPRAPATASVAPPSNTSSQVGKVNVTA
jgi:hypothetical protein